MEGISEDRDIVISYVTLHRRANVQHLTLLLNSYWAHAAFDLGPINYSKISELTKKVQNNAMAILKVCQAPPRQILKRNNPHRKRCHQTIDYFDSKRPKLWFYALSCYVEGNKLLIKNWILCCFHLHTLLSELSSLSINLGFFSLRVQMVDALLWEVGIDFTVYISFILTNVLNILSSVGSRNYSL